MYTYDNIRKAVTLDLTAFMIHEFAPINLYTTLGTYHYCRHVQTARLVELENGKRTGNLLPTVLATLEQILIPYYCNNI